MKKKEIEKDIERENERENDCPFLFSRVEEHLNMTGHNYVAQCCWLQMLAAIIPHFRRGVSAPDPYNGVNAAVAEMTHTKEMREKERTKRVLYSKKERADELHYERPEQDSESRSISLYKLFLLAQRKEGDNKEG